jgi:hypothetical protein
MNSKQVALLALLSLGGSALVAQPPDAPPPDQYQPGDSYAAQPAAYDDAQPADQYAQDQGGPVDETYFYDQLSPYGHWVESRYHGWVWLPYSVRAGWRPYALGHWVMTDYGWTWASDEPFGWATYHYGRWAYDPDYGWEWIPGYEWGPAWVAWRTGGGYIGWAPLPPEVGFRVGFGLDYGGVDINVALGPTHFCFVEERAFLRPNVFTYVEPSARNVTIIHNTTNITNYTVVNNRVVNQGVPVQHVEQVTGQRVQRLQVAAVKSGAASRSAQVRGNQLTVFQPTIVRKSASTPPPPPQLRARATGADLQRRHQQETQALQAQQTQDRARLQQIHQREAAGGNQRSTPSNQRAPQEQATQQQQRQQQEQQQQTDQRQSAQQRSAPNNQDLAQRHQAEVQAQQQQHQREQQQLQARHQAEQQAAQRQPQQRQQPQQQQREKKPQQEQKSPPPPHRR